MSKPIKELIYNNITDNNCMEELTFAQQLILGVAVQKNRDALEFQNLWSNYSENYDDYNDCHGDYYDAE